MSYQQPYGGGPPNQYGGPPPGQPPYGQQQQQQQQQPYGQQQQGYGQGPPGGYPPQNQQYGAPPPQNQQYGAPPPQNQQYGAPPPQGNQYGAPPPQGNQYGAPPPQGNQYGAPPQHQQAHGQGPPQHYNQPPPQQYGQPAYNAPQQSYVAPDAPSPGYSAGPPIAWDGTADAKALRKAMKGFGTDERALIAVLAPKDALQVTVLRQNYSHTQSRDLLADIASEVSGELEETLLALARGPLAQDCAVLRAAMRGPGTKEEALNDVLLGRSNADIAAIKAHYQQALKRDLEADLKGELSMQTERHFLMVVAGTRAESGAPVLPHQVDQDVQEIYKATEGKTGTDELLVCSIMSSRNDAQIAAIARAYEGRFRRSLEDVIKSEFSGHMERALLHQLRSGTDRAMCDALLLEDAMSGLGTDERLLLNRVVRAHWDRAHLRNVKGAYRQKFGKDLVARVKGEVGGDFERALVACLGE